MLSPVYDMIDGTVSDGVFLRCSIDLFRCFKCFAKWVGKKKRRRRKVDAAAVELFDERARLP